MVWFSMDMFVYQQGSWFDSEISLTVLHLHLYEHLRSEVS